ncbi:hypothetical protein ACHWI2_33325, partial [Klebsiella pneumoniae]
CSRMLIKSASISDGISIFKGGLGVVIEANSLSSKIKMCCCFLRAAIGALSAKGVAVVFYDIDVDRATKDMERLR